ncbi:hypothetical protein HK096_000725 [Nowakowskiella sp. JEL0078]|nr:hypothetical protein HK096_000725 [Nowakowskiella sp. JEL0078]
MLTLPPSQAKRFLELLFSRMTLSAKEAVIEILWSTLTPPEQSIFDLPIAGSPSWSNEEILRGLSRTFITVETSTSNPETTTQGQFGTSISNNPRLTSISNARRSIRRPSEGSELESDNFSRRSFIRQRISDPAVSRSLLPTSTSSQTATNSNVVNNSISSEYAATVDSVGRRLTANNSTTRTALINLEDHILQVLIEALQRSTPRDREE